MGNLRNDALSLGETETQCISYRGKTIAGTVPCDLPMDKRYAFISNNFRGFTPTFVYFIHDGSYLKVGKSDNPEKRLLQLQTGNPRVLTLLRSIKCASQKEGFALENSVHQKLKPYRCRGEWFEVSKPEADTLWKSKE